MSQLPASNIRLSAIVPTLAITSGITIGFEVAAASGNAFSTGSLAGATVLGAAAGGIGALLDRWVRPASNEHETTGSVEVKRMAFGAVAGTAILIGLFIALRSVIPMLFAEEHRAYVLGTFAKQAAPSPTVEAVLRESNDPQVTAREMSARGIARFELADLLKWNASRLAMARSSQALCLNMVDGEEDPKAFGAALTAMSEAERRDFASVLSRAMHVEAVAVSEATPLPPRDAGALADAALAVASMLGTPHGRSWQQKLSSGSPEQRCEAFQTFLRKIPQLDEPLATRVLRLMAAGPSQ